MRKFKLNYRSKAAGQALVIVIILLAVIGAGMWYLTSTKTAMDREARAFGREVVKRITVDHDLAFLADHLSPQAKLDNPPSQQQYIIQRFQQLGVPAQPIKIDEDVTWESYFFEPHGIFTAHLNYAAQGGMLQLNVSHPESRWQIDNIMFTMQPPR